MGYGAVRAYTIGPVVTKGAYVWADAHQEEKGLEQTEKFNIPNQGTLGGVR